jgi:hypothetical protein
MALLASAFVAGYLMSKSKNDRAYWTRSSIFILIFGVVEGLRFGRLVDWNVYYIRFLDIGKGTVAHYEPLFTMICKFFYGFGLPYWSFVFLQCVFLAFSCCLVIKNYKNISLWAMPLLVTLLYMNENFIRWYLACSFLLVAFYYLQKEQRMKMLLCLVAAVCSHSGTIVLTPLFFLDRIINRKIANEKIFAVLFLLFTFVVHIRQMQFLVQMANFFIKIGLGNLGQMGGYLGSAQHLINGQGAADLGYFGRSFSNQLRMCISFLPIILLAPKYVKEYRLGLFFYNLFCLGAVLDPVFSMVEILGRISGFFTLFYFVVGGATYYHIVMMKKEKVYVRCLLFLSFFCGVYPGLSIVFQKLSFYEMTFIWDAGALEYLPLNYFL